MKGKIVIQDKVYFKPNGLEKPKKEDYPKYQERYSDAANDTVLNLLSYKEALKEYEASRQLIEVSNHIAYRHREERKIPYFSDIKGVPLITDGQPCKAEVENNIAIIIKIN